MAPALLMTARKRKIFLGATSTSSLPDKLTDAQAVSHSAAAPLPTLRVGVVGSYILGLKPRCSLFVGTRGGGKPRLLPG